MTGKELRETLKRGERVYGTAGVSPSPKWPGMMAGTGVDFVFIDTEHVPYTRETVAWMCEAYKGVGIVPIVRLTSPDPYLATVALDGGACGIVAPYLETVDQIRQLRGAVKLRPLKGERLQNILEGKEEPEPELAEYVEEKCANNLLIVNIESVPAVERLDELLSVPDIDAVLVGPHDLTCSLGIPEQYTHPKFRETMRTIIDKSRDRGLGVGLHISYGLDEEIFWAKEGANLILHSSDISLVQDSLVRDIAEVRAAFGETDSEESGPDGIVI